MEGRLKMDLMGRSVDLIPMVPSDGFELSVPPVHRHRHRGEQQVSVCQTVPHQRKYPCTHRGTAAITNRGPRGTQRYCNDDVRTGGDEVEDAVQLLYRLVIGFGNNSVHQRLQKHTHTRARAQTEDESREIHGKSDGTYHGEIGDGFTHLHRLLLLLPTHKDT